MSEKTDLLWELECAEANLSTDIQALSYILDDLDTTHKNIEMILIIPEIKNSIEILLKSMIYNKENMQKVIEENYDERKKISVIGEGEK